MHRFPDHLGDLLGGGAVGPPLRIGEGRHGPGDGLHVGRVRREHEGAGGEVGADAPGRHGLHPDAEGLHFEGQALAPALQAPLGGVVDGIEREGDQTADGGGGEDHALSLGAQGRKEGLGHPHHPEQVGVQLPDQLVVRRPLEGPRQPVSRIVEQHVHRAPGQRRRGRGLDLRRVGHVQGQEGDPLDGRQLRFLVRVAHGGDDVPAPGGEQQGRGPAKPRGRAGDEDGL